MARMTLKQREVWRNTILDNHRWNISYGATRSGKTYLDYFKIPRRLERCTGDGLILLLGNTQQTLERNILAPMRKMYGVGLVGDIRRGVNQVRLFGHDVYALGAEKINQVSKIQGAGFEYVYGDEITTWNRNVFDMLKSRLDKAHSCFDGTCNPEAPTHWFKEFLESDADIYAQKFSIDDNPFLDPTFVANLKKEYAGTVLFDRYILGNWVAAEGAIYKHFADNPERYIIDEVPKGLVFATIGIDFGGNKSGHSFTFTGFWPKMKGIVTLADFYRRGIITPDQLAEDFITFVRRCEGFELKIVEIRADSAEPVLIAGLQKALIEARLPYAITNAIKEPIINRIRLYTVLLAHDNWQIMRSCESTIEAFRTAVFDSKALEDKRLDDGTTIIDPIDSQEYSTEPYSDALLYGGLHDQRISHKARLSPSTRIE